MQRSSPKRKPETDEDALIHEANMDVDTENDSSSSSSSSSSSANKKKLKKNKVSLLERTSSRISLLRPELHAMLNETDDEKTAYVQLENRITSYLEDKPKNLDIEIRALWIPTKKSIQIEMTVIENAIRKNWWTVVDLIFNAFVAAQEKLKDHAINDMFSNLLRKPSTPLSVLKAYTEQYYPNTSFLPIQDDYFLPSFFGLSKSDISVDWLEKIKFVVSSGKLTPEHLMNLIKNAVLSISRCCESKSFHFPHTQFVREVIQFLIKQLPSADNFFEYILINLLKKDRLISDEDWDHFTEQKILIFNSPVAFCCFKDRALLFKKYKKNKEYINLIENVFTTNPEFLMQFHQRDLRFFDKLFANLSQSNIRLLANIISYILKQRDCLSLKKPLLISVLFKFILKALVEEAEYKSQFIEQYSILFDWIIDQLKEKISSEIKEERQEQIQFLIQNNSLTDIVFIGFLHACTSEQLVRFGMELFNYEDKAGDIIRLFIEFFESNFDKISPASSEAKEQKTESSIESKDSLSHLITKIIYFIIKIQDFKLLRKIDARQKILSATDIILFLFEQTLKENPIMESIEKIEAVKYFLTKVATVIELKKITDILDKEKDKLPKFALLYVSEKKASGALKELEEAVFAQSTHTAAVHQSASDAARKLFNHYLLLPCITLEEESRQLYLKAKELQQIDMIQCFLKEERRLELLKYDETIRFHTLAPTLLFPKSAPSASSSSHSYYFSPHEIALRFLSTWYAPIINFSFMFSTEQSQYYQNFIDPGSNLSISAVLAAAWMAASDESEFKTVEDQLSIKRTLILLIAESARGYNGKSNSGVDKPACPGGLFNNILAALDKKHSLVNITYLKAEKAIEVINHFIDEKFSLLSEGEKRKLIEVIQKDEYSQIPPSFFVSQEGAFKSMVINTFKGSDAFIEELLTLYSQHDGFFLYAVEEARFPQLFIYKKQVEEYQAKTRSSLTSLRSTI